MIHFWTHGLGSIKTSYVQIYNTWSWFIPPFSAYALDNRPIDILLLLQQSHEVVYLLELTGQAMLRDCLVSEIVGTIDFGDCLLIGFFQTIDFGDWLLIGIVWTISVCYFLTIGIVRQMIVETLVIDARTIEF